ncbi:cell wall-binding repeat-containing protein [Propioniciclava sp. MC1683]|uniref:cell wall-binding repeat-containing protein n=1 Tax=Propioniciclava sp. MC1683 TaxID=2760309 RepID=UPI00160392DC|nr:cell wall-binding repeat-containing protein [Propioniciclava sp. MC1683]MBB1501344.1 cell wall-binding repeat-containing protein [Propioniciclava sp. MC1683]
MSKKTRALALLSAGALTLTMAPQAFAAVIDTDPQFRYTEWNAGIHRIADNDAISTAIEASMSRTDWGYDVRTQLQYNAPNTTWHGAPARADLAEGAVVQLPIGKDQWVQATVVKNTTQRTMHIIVARDDEYTDALAATPLADVLNAPLLLNPKDKLDPRVETEIKRLASYAAGRGEHVQVHLLGGTNALSHDVENAIDKAIDANNLNRTTTRHQGVDRYQTAVSLGLVTVNYYGIESRDKSWDVNVYLTTGKNFPDALAAGAAASANDGIVLLTNDEALDNRGFTDDFLIGLRTWVKDKAGQRVGWSFNTTENFAVGGQATRAAAANDIRVAKSYDGRDRYETATLLATDTFKAPGVAGNPSYFAVAPGTDYKYAVVASAYIANADGPLLLTKVNELVPTTKAYLQKNVENRDSIFVFGSENGSITNAVSADIKKAVNW